MQLTAAVKFLFINPRNQRVEKRWQPLGEQPALLLNMAEDAQTGRLFVTDNSKAKTTRCWISIPVSC